MTMLKRLHNKVYIEFLCMVYNCRDIISIHAHLMLNQVSVTKVIMEQPDRFFRYGYALLTNSTFFLQMIQHLDAANLNYLIRKEGLNFITQIILLPQWVFPLHSSYIDLTKACSSNARAELHIQHRSIIGPHSKSPIGRMSKGCHTESKIHTVES